jgi:hypothetical protein
VEPSVVLIQTTAGLGSGVVFDNQGDIVTNNHVAPSPPPTATRLPRPCWGPFRPTTSPCCAPKASR